jgi:hypothetical protein
MKPHDDRLAAALRDLPLPALDGAIEARALGRARAASETRLRRADAAVAILLLSAACVFALDAAVKMARAFGG